MSKVICIFCRQVNHPKFLCHLIKPKLDFNMYRRLIEYQIQRKKDDK